MKLIADNQIELSYANALAVVEAFEQGKVAHIYKTNREGITFSVSIVPNDEHYTDAELERRTSPYLPPEAWAGVLVPDYDRLYPANDNESE